MIELHAELLVLSTVKLVRLNELSLFTYVQVYSSLHSNSALSKAQNTSTLNNHTILQ